MSPQGKWRRLWKTSVLVPAFGVFLVLTQVVLTFSHQAADAQIVTAGMGAILYPVFHEITRRRDDP